jgi:serine/threonine protein kinase
MLLATRNSDGKRFAIKTVPKKEYDQEKMKHLRAEISVLLSIDHEYIIKCYEVFEDPINIQFVFDLVEGGDLLDYLITTPGNKISESKAVEFFHEIVLALQYLHDKSIVHRDIKPENFLIYHDKGRIKIKLIDFGFASFLKNGKLNDLVGSPQYVAPEILNGDEYDTKVDMWAAGVCLYNMLTGTQPFISNNNEEELRNNILNQEIHYHKDLSNDAVDMLKGLLERDPEKRLSAPDCRIHPWIYNFENLKYQPTQCDGVRFDPDVKTIKDIMLLINEQYSVKNEVWVILLSDLDYDLTYEIEKTLLNNISSHLEDFRGFQMKNSVSYEVLLETIINNNKVQKSLQDTLKGKKII